MNKYLLLFILAIALFSCKKKPETILVVTPPAAASAYVYYPMKVGNYWVYTWAQGDTNNVPLGGQNVTDSVYVQKDTIINGNTYFVLVDAISSMFGGIFRDSSGYMVDVYGRIQFSTSNFTDVLKTDSIFTPSLVEVNQWKMLNDVAISTPAGNFNAIQFKGFITYCSFFPLNPKFYRASSYAKQIGLIQTHSYYQNNPDAIVNVQLIRYHVQ